MQASSVSKPASGPPGLDQQNAAPRPPGLSHLSAAWGPPGPVLPPGLPGLDSLEQQASGALAKHATALTKVSFSSTQNGIIGLYAWICFRDKLGQLIFFKGIDLDQYQ